jgi:hypothetical protein
LEATEKRALLEIDRERALNTRTQKTLEQAQSESKTTSESHRRELKEYQNQIATLMQ